MKRRSFLKKSAGVLSAASLAPLSGFATYTQTPFIKTKTIPDYTVVGAGVFGVWTAFYLQQLGAQVLLLDAYGPGNSRASSGGETRILRADYRDKLHYSKMNIRAHELWSRWQKEWGAKFMLPTGRLTLGDEGYEKQAITIETRMSGMGVSSEVLDREELEYRWPQINYDKLTVGLYFPGGPGGSTLMARESTRLTAEKFVENGGQLRIATAYPGKRSSKLLQDLVLNNNESISSGKIIFACGPWMGKVFPEIFLDRLKVFRRDVLFIGAATGDDRYSYPNLPVWIFNNPGDSRYYGMPDIHGRGLKVAPFPDHNSIDMDRDERIVNPTEIKRVREFVAKRFPGLKDQPLLEGRVCQLTFSQDEEFIIDQHPDLDNVWFVCAGSGHGFKHGPALGEYVANRLMKNTELPEFDMKFSLK